MHPIDYTTAADALAAASDLAYAAGYPQLGANMDHAAMVDRTTVAVRSASHAHLAVAEMDKLVGTCESLALRARACNLPPLAERLCMRAAHLAADRRELAREALYGRAVA